MTATSYFRAKTLRHAQLGTAVLLLLIAGIAKAASPALESPQLTEERPIVEGTYAGHARLSVNSFRHRATNHIEVEIQFHATGGALKVFNPFFDDLSIQPASLALFDAQKNYMGDLLVRQSGSHRGPHADEWMTIPKAGYVGVSKQVAAVIGNQPLRPGKYFLQLIYSRLFWSTSPARNGIISNEDLARWIKDHAGDDYFRSNSVEFEIPSE